MKYVIHTLFLVLVALAVSCKHEGQNMPDAGAVRVKFSSAYANAPGAVAAGPERVDRVNAYLCSEGVVKKVFTLEALGDLIIDEQYHFASSKLYVIANPSGCKALEAVGEGSSESVFATLPLEGPISKVTLHGVADLTGKVDQEVAMVLERSVARFDLKVDAGRGIEVEAVHFEGLPKAGMLFPAACDYSERVKHSVTTNATAAVEGIHYCYELPTSAGGLVASLDVRYDGNLATLVVPVGEVKRNCIYNLNVRAYDGKVTATLEASTMDEGDTDTGRAVYTHTVIDQPNSNLGTKAAFISPTMVNLPNKDYQITLALSGDYDKTYAVEGDPDAFTITIAADVPFKSSKLQIKSTKNQEYYSSGRAAILVVSHVEGGTTVTDRISVVQDSPEPFPIVTIGGLQWMAVNALGRELTKYPIIPKGQTVREYMKISDNWYRYAAACYQWGPRATQKPFKPWDYWGVRSDALAAYNGPITGLPASKIWEGPTLPCPDGWRLPTFEECKRIWAPNTATLPAIYTIDGVEYTMTAERTGFNIATAYITNNAYNIIISDGTNELIFPAGGHRKASNYINEEIGPNENVAISGYANRVGMIFYIWTQTHIKNKPNELPVVGYSGSGKQPIKVALDGAGAYGWTETNAFSYVRCVRDIE